jgi:hypothetical protein
MTIVAFAPFVAMATVALGTGSLPGKFLDFVRVSGPVTVTVEIIAIFCSRIIGRFRVTLPVTVDLPERVNDYILNPVHMFGHND